MDCGFRKGNQKRLAGLVDTNKQELFCQKIYQL